MDGRQARGEHTRIRILETAALAFAEHGYDGTSLNAIVRASGLTKGAFYHHFASKEELALATFRREQLRLVEGVVAAATTAGDAVDTLEVLLRERARILRSDRATRAVLTLGADFRAHATVGSTFSAFQETAIDLFADLLRRGQEEGVVRGDVDPRAGAELVFAAIVGMDDVSRFLSDLTDLESRTEALLDLLVRGLGTPRTNRLEGS
jgi:AcrR family transcriptional regulator